MPSFEPILATSLVVKDLSYIISKFDNLSPPYSLFLNSHFSPHPHPSNP
jgi:hypothetical protein